MIYTLTTLPIMFVLILSMNTSCNERPITNTSLSPKENKQFIQKKKSTPPKEGDAKPLIEAKGDFYAENIESTEGVNIKLVIKTKVSHKKSIPLAWDISPEPTDIKDKRFQAIAGDFYFKSSEQEHTIILKPIYFPDQGGDRNYTIYFESEDKKHIFTANILIKDPESEYIKNNKIALGAEHSCFIVDGAVRCVGQNINDELGDGGIEDSHLYTQEVINMEEGTTSIASHSHHTCGINAGALYCWGKNNKGQLGVDDVTNRYEATKVIGLESDVTQVAVGAEHTCALSLGKIYCFGYNARGQLGSSDTGSLTLVATEVKGMEGGVTSIATGENHTCAIKLGTLYCWGDNEKGQLGSEGTSNFSEPHAVSSLYKDMTHIAAGGNTTCALQKQDLYCWGDNSKKQVSAKTAETIITKPLFIASKVTDVVVGGGHTCAVINNKMACWGDNTKGQLGQGDFNQYDNMMAIKPVANITGLEISLGAEHTCVADTKKTYCFGNNTAGQLSLGHTNPIPSLSEVIYQAPPKEE